MRLSMRLSHNIKKNAIELIKNDFWGVVYSLNVHYMKLIFLTRKEQAIAIVEQYRQAIEAVVLTLENLRSLEM